MSDLHALVTRKTCGRCGVYRNLHPIDRCKGFRASWWWDRHFLLQHVGTWLWIHAMPSRLRWSIAHRLAKRGRDWCRLVDSALRADQWKDQTKPYPSMGHKSDYSGKWGCLCDFPQPWSVGPPEPGRCYCCPPDEDGAA